MERIKKENKKYLDKFMEQKLSNRRLWNIDETSAELLYMLAEIKNPKYILEIGTSNGFSTFWISLYVKNYDCSFHTIEIDEERFKMAKENLKDFPKINFHFGNAEEIIPQLSDGIDFVFIDAGKIGYINYIKLLLPKLSDKAVIVADNILSHSKTVEKYCDFIKNDERFKTMTLDIDSGFEISIFNKK